MVRGVMLGRRGPGLRGSRLSRSHDVVVRSGVHRSHARQSAVCRWTARGGHRRRDRRGEITPAPSGRARRRGALARRSDVRRTDVDRRAADRSGRDDLAIGQRAAHLGGAPGECRPAADGVATRRRIDPARHHRPRRSRGRLRAAGDRLATVRGVGRHGTGSIRAPGARLGTRLLPVRLPRHRSARGHRPGDANLGGRARHRARDGRDIGLPGCGRAVGAAPVDGREGGADARRTVHGPSELQLPWGRSPSSSRSASC